jgi:hypothetical protein
MRDIWNAIKSIFVNDAHNIISQRGKEILAEQQNQREMKETAVKWLEEFLKQHDCAYSSLDYYEFKIPMHIFDKKFEEAKEMEKAQIMRAARQCHFEGVRQSAKSGQGYADYAEQYYNETTTKPLTNLEISDRRLWLFLNWLIKHYNTASNSIVSYYTNVRGEEVSIEEILEHHNKEK